MPWEVKLLSTVSSAGKMNTSPNPPSFDPQAVAIIGEYTVPSGPTIDDHFLVVILRSGSLLEYPIGKAVQVAASLESALSIKIEYHLCNVANSASRIMFPPSLEDHPLFSFTGSVSGWNGVFRALLSFGVTEVTARPTKEVMDYLHSSNAQVTETNH